MNTNTALNFRINDVELKLFREKCDLFSRKPGDVLREMIVAFNEDRLKITLSDSQTKERRSLYHESGE